MNQLCDQVLKQIKCTEHLILHQSMQAHHVNQKRVPRSLHTRFLDADDELLFALDSRIIGVCWQTVFYHACGDASQWVHIGFDFEARCLIHDQLVAYLLTRTKAPV